MIYKYLQDKTKSKEKPMTINELETTHNKFSDFALRANVVLQKSGVEPFFYNSEPITGCLNNPDILFMGINPGLGREDFGRIAEEADFVQSECKYIKENKGKLPLATNVVDIVLGGDEKRLAKCAETSFKSFFATPDEKALNKQLNALTNELRQEHKKLMSEAINTILNEVKPKNIVCIGFGSFHSYVRGSGVKDSEFYMAPSIKSKSGKSDIIFYKRAIVNSIPVHGVLHLSGAQISDEIREAMREIIKSL